MPEEKQMPPPMAPVPAMGQPQNVQNNAPSGMPPPMNANQGAEQKTPPPMNAPNAPSFPQGPAQKQDDNTTIEEIEEVVETIIDERWKEVTENIKKVLEWKTAMEEKFSKMEEDIKNLKDDFNGLYKAIVGKVGDYDKNILKVNSELQALEKVFSQVLPNFTANVNELTRITQDLKEHHHKK